MEIGRIIGINLNKLRTERNLSLGQLAELCKISKVMLSQIEKGDTNPTINTIWKIANGLKVPYTALLEQQEHENPVIAKADTLMQTDDNDHYRVYCYYENTPQRNFELFQIELDVGHRMVSIGHSSKSREYAMVLSGELTVTTQGQKYVLGPDDAVEFDSSAEHIYFSSGAQLLRAVIINFYPS